mgnify:FL=1
MRPIRRNTSPQNNDFDDYTEAKPFLISRLGSYCSYCERRIATQLAVEHIQPKGLSQYAHLIGRWSNFLLACVNCNSTKKNKDVVLSRVLLPDRDNTFYAYIYSPDGKIETRNDLSPDVRMAAENTLRMVGLDKSSSQIHDENGKMVAIDRYAQRMEVFLVAQSAKSDIASNVGNDAVRRGAIRTAMGYGFFSIWMTVFANDLDMQKSLVDAFNGTAASGCFDSNTMKPISPAPNPDGLAHGGKI